MPSFVMKGILVAAMAGAAAHAQQTVDATVAQQQYAEIKARVLGGDYTVDWRAFRVAAVNSGVGAGFKSRVEYNRAMADTDAGRLDAALAATQEAIDRNMADPEAHLLAARVLQAMSRWNDAERERMIEAALVKSIFDSGDGRASATPFFVVSALEEDFFIMTALGVLPKSHNPTTVGEQNLDKVLVDDWEGPNHPVWFVRLKNPGIGEPKG